MSASATALAVLMLALVAACGDGGEQASRARDGGTTASGAELRQIALALEQLDERIARLETETEELLELLGDDASPLRDLRALIEELQQSRARLGALAEGLSESPSPSPSPAPR